MRSDFKLVKYHLQFGRYFGLNPYSLDHKLETITRKRKFVLLLLAITYTSIGIYCINYRTCFYQSFKQTQIFIEFIQSSVDVLNFLSIILLGNFYYKNEWKILCSSINIIELYFNNQEFPLKTSFTAKIIYSAVFYCSFVTVFIYELYVWFTSGLLEKKAFLSYIPYGIVNIYRYLNLYVTLTVLNMYKNRYNFLIQKCKKLLLLQKRLAIQRKVQVKPNCFYDSQFFIRQKKEIKKIYRLLNISINQFSKVSGWPIMIFILNGILQNLLTINNYLVDDHKNTTEFSIGLQIMSVTIPGIFLV